MNDNLTLADLAQRVYAEELALGLSQQEAVLVARCVRCSDEYRDAWLAGRAERRKEKEEITDQVVKDAENYRGNPEEWEARGY